MSIESRSANEFSPGPLEISHCSAPDYLSRSELVSRERESLPSDERGRERLRSVIGSSGGDHCFLGPKQVEVKEAEGEESIEARVSSRSEAFIRAERNL